MVPVPDTLLLQDIIFNPKVIMLCTGRLVISLMKVSGREAGYFLINNALHFFRSVSK